MSGYKRKLSHPKWQKKRLKILERDNFKCALCLDEETELHVHHEKYSGEPWEAGDEYLKTLCSHCHEIIHYDKLNTTSIESVFKNNFEGDDDLIIVFLKFKNLDYVRSYFLSYGDINSNGVFPIKLIKKYLDKWLKD